MLAADGELASAAARKPADTAASWQDTVMQEVVADTPSALKTVVEVFVAGALHVDTKRGEKTGMKINTVGSE